MRHMSDISQRINQYGTRISQIKNFKNHGDLYKMLHNICFLFDKLDRELVICRRSNHYTMNYCHLHETINEYCNNLEKYLIVACLLD